MNPPLSRRLCPAYLCLLALVALCFSPLPCAAAEEKAPRGKSRYRSKIPASKQRSGDAQRGYKYLVEGDYLVYGVPIELFKAARPAGPNRLKRKGDQAGLAYHYTAVTAPNGVRVVTSNCLRCHAQSIDGKFIVGLGNSTVDFTTDRRATVRLVDTMIAGLHGPNSPQRMAYKTLHDRFQIVSPLIQTRVRGVNPADNLAFVLARYRDPETLEWIDNPPAAESGEKTVVVPTDVPPLWLVKKKNALYYTASGRGDFARLIMASSLLTLEDSTEAAEIDENFADVLAFLESLEAPKWPRDIDPAKARQGEQLFKDECARCHGTYGPQGEFPNYVISLDKVGTDPLLSNWQTSIDGLSYAESWFGEGPYAARLEPGEGYIAPPLDGIWATAPYLHNGSVPDMQTLLDSKQRPRFWQRSFNTSDYDFQTMGWRYREHADPKPGDKNVYDTTLPGYGNQGHTFADDLSEEERQALIEYLKTL